MSIDIDDATALDIALELGFHFSDFATEVFDHTFAIDGINEHGNGQAVIKIDKGGEPVGIDKARITSDKEGAVVGIVNFDITPVHFNGFGGNNVFDMASSLGEDADRSRDGRAGPGRVGVLGVTVFFANKREGQVHMRLV